MSRRPLKFRHGARVLLVAGDEVLLVNDSDPGIPGSSWWVLPGGGIDPGERPDQAAVREVGEETGLNLGPGELVGPIATGIAIHGYSDRIRVQEEVIFRAVVERFAPDNAGWTQWERRRMKGMVWHPVESLPQPVWPSRLAELLTVPSGRIVDLGVREESSVPLSEHELREITDRGWVPG
ncbi:NUDIX hydrolase [Arachnia propionica]|uniref:NUDIX domain-containing protein n=1 Tax=Arachnia propionica TaxID=1750 RepID=A0A3P1WQZ4_9ACTN|nr:NUDIX domain-containing protein [Arachnia propionica]RRD48386.1 NUDIX domain-containing protein [Arachnia propionica]